MPSTVLCGAFRFRKPFGSHLGNEAGATLTSRGQCRRIPSPGAVAVIATFCALVSGYVDWHGQLAVPVSMRAENADSFIAGTSGLTSHLIPEPSYSRVVSHETDDRHSHVRVLHLGRRVSQSPSGKKLVALVEIRNAEAALSGFLGALALFVDSVIILDDHSTDLSHVEVFKAAGRGVPVELLIRKTGQWVRQELRDRQILLKYGRLVGGTHFVLPDYDEVFSSNCAANGTLREAIFSLDPGESLAIPWVEVWKSSSQHRVLPHDPEMNFLTRRQTIVFADDGKVGYTMRSAAARSLQPPGYPQTITNIDHGEAASIHALRCPRDLCPPPPRYRGPSTPLSSSSSTKTLRDCRIIEFKFINMANVLTKAAWYEVLGRVMGVSDNVTRGKMFEALPDGTEGVSTGSDGISLARVDDSWLSGYGNWADSAFDRVELWRVSELLAWTRALGPMRRRGLRALSLLDLSRLHAAAERARELGVQVRDAPRARMLGTVVVIVEFGDGDILSPFLQAMGGCPARVPAGTAMWSSSNSSATSFGTWSNLPENHERWRAEVLKPFYLALSKCENGFVYVPAVGIGSPQIASMLRMLAMDMPDVDGLLVGLRGIAESGLNTDARLLESLRLARRLSSSPGSHMRCVEMDLRVLGSLSGVYALHLRVIAGASRTARAQVKWRKILELSEALQKSKFLSELRGVAQGALRPVARLVFSLNVGRSGSLYVSRLVASAAASGVVADHEPACPNATCSGGGALPMQERKLSTSRAERRDIKCPMIREALASGIRRQGARVSFKTCTGNPSAADRARGGGGLIEWSGLAGCTVVEFEDFVYIETNPNFRSWMYDVVFDEFLDYGYDMSVLVLRKYIPAVVRSLYDTGYFRTRNGYNWMETANGVNAMIAPIGNDSDLDACDKVISYVLNAEAVTRHIMRLYRSRMVKFIERRSEEVYEKLGGLQLLHELGLRLTPEALRDAGVRVDKYGEGITYVRRREALVLFEKRVREYLEKSERLGISLPQSMEHMFPFPGFDYDWRH